MHLDPVFEEDQGTKEVALDLVAGRPRDDDQVVEHAGEEVLRIAGPVSELLDGGTLDVVTQPGPGTNGSEAQIVGIGVVPPAGPDAPPTDDS